MRLSLFLFFSFSFLKGLQRDTPHLQRGCYLSFRAKQTSRSTTTGQKKRVSRGRRKQKRVPPLSEWHSKFDLIHQLYWIAVSAASYMDGLYLLWPSFHSASVFTQLRRFQEGVGQLNPAPGDRWKCVCHALLIHSGGLTAQRRRWGGTPSQLILACRPTSVSGASGSTPRLTCLSISCCQSPV